MLGTVEHLWWAGSEASGSRRAQKSPGSWSGSHGATTGKHLGKDWGTVESPDPGRGETSVILEFDSFDGTEMPKSVTLLVSCPRLR